MGHDARDDGADADGGAVVAAAGVDDVVGGEAADADDADVVDGLRDDENENDDAGDDRLAVVVAWNILPPLPQQQQPHYAMTNNCRAS